MPPCNRNGRVEQHILIVGGMYAHNPAQLARLHQFLYILVCRIHDVGESAVIDNTLFTRKIGENARLLGAQAERLFAENMLAVFQRRLCHFKVHAVRRCNVDQINIRIGYHALPVGGVTAVAHCLCKRGNLLLADIRHHLKHRHIIAENHFCVVKCGGMRPAHPAGADQTNANLFHPVYLLVCIAPHSSRFFSVRGYKLSDPYCKHIKKSSVCFFRCIRIAVGHGFPPDTSAQYSLPEKKQIPRNSSACRIVFFCTSF